MDRYVEYVRELFRRGYSENDIRGALLKTGFNPETINYLIEASSKPSQEAKIDVNATQSAHTALQSIADQPINPNSAKESLAARFVQPSPAIVSEQDSPLSFLAAMKGYIIVFIICLIPTIVIIFNAIQKGHITTFNNLLLVSGDTLGTIGLCLYVSDMILATRFYILEDLFGGLNKVYIAHAIIGSAALIAIMIHPVLLAIRYMPLGVHTVGDFFIPNTTYIASAYGIFALALMLILIILTFYVRLPYRIWLRTHKLLGLAYLLIVLHVLYEPNNISGNFFIGWYLLIIMLIGLVALVYRTVLPNVLVKRYLYLLTGVEKKATSVLELKLSPTNKIMNFKAGQFVFISFKVDGISPEWHPFTIVSPPSNQDLSIDVKSLGAYTETLTRILPSMVGMSVRIEGAYGRFSYRNFRNINQIWVAGGIGITPFISMAQSLGSGSYNIDLYYSVKSESELIDIEVLMRQQSNNPNQTFRLIPFVTDKYKKFLTTDVIAAASGDLKKRDFLICGPPAMMNSMKKQLLDAGVHKYNIHSEEFSIT